MAKHNGEYNLAECQLRFMDSLFRGDMHRLPGSRAYRLSEQYIELLGLGLVRKEGHFLSLTESGRYAIRKEWRND